MVAQIIDGKQIAANFRNTLKQRISSNESDDVPVLAVILVGGNDASNVYVKHKKKAAEEVGMGCEVLELAETIGENALLQTIDELNADHHIHGIIVQLPLPKHIDVLKVLSRIDPKKDVDGFSPFNNGLLSYNSPDTFVSATPLGILKLLQNIKIDLEGKHAVIIGRSNIVGKPMAMLLLNHNCTTTIVHSKSNNIESIVQTADIVIVACGKPKLVKESWIKDGAVVIDVGINRLDGKLCGDVDFEDVKNKASFITPVPGGVGPMTVAMLLENTYKAFEQRCKNNSCHCHKSGCCHS